MNKMLKRFRIIVLMLAMMVLTSAFASAGDTPGRGGDVVGVYGQFPAHFNAAIQSGAAIMTPAAQLFVGLLQVDEDWKPQPYLAQSWEISDDGLTYTFHLVEGTVFHDGKPVTSADVIYSIGVVKNNHPFGQNMYGAIEKTEAPDPNTVVVRLSRPQPSMLLAMTPVLTPILPRHIYDDGTPIRKHPANTKGVIGSGPFKLKEYKPGKHFILERFDKFLRPGRPYLDRYIGIQITDPNAVEAALRKGEVHSAGFNAGLKLVNVEKLKSAKNLTWRKDGYEGVGSYVYLEFNLRNKPFDDVRVRKAIAHAIDIDFIINSLHLGMSKRATGPIMPDTNPFYSADVPSFGYDLEKANQLLDEAGYPKKEGGMRFKATLDRLPFVYDDGQVIAEYLKPQLKKIGIDVDLRRPAGMGPWYMNMAKWNFEMSVNIVFCYADPIIGVHRLWDSKNIKHVPWSNTIGYKNERVDELMAKAAVEMDLEKRKVLYAEFQKLVVADVPFVFLHQPAYHTFNNVGLGGFSSGIWNVMAPADGLYWKEGGPVKN